MTENGTDQAQDRTGLRSRLSDLAEIFRWTEGLASRYAIPANVQFAMDLCLEEVLSNIIRHGYADEEDRSVIVGFTVPRAGYFVLVVDDEAPHFNPLDIPDLPMANPYEETHLGGQGIRLLRRFADALTYESTPNGNRLRIGFSDLQ